MESTFFGIEIGKRSLIAQRKALNVVSHNLSNSSREGYSRQRVAFGTLDPLYRSDLTRAERPGQIGQGGEVISIRRERDLYLDVRLLNDKSSLAYWKQEQTNVQGLERVYHALDDHNLQEKLDSFWGSWQELVYRGEEPAARAELLERSEDLTGSIRNQFSRLYSLKSEAHLKIAEQVTQINDLAENIAQLNRRIEAVEATGDNPNDLLDTRDQRIEELAQFTSVHVSHNDMDETMVFVNGSILVQGRVANTIDVIDGVDDKYTSRLIFRNTQDPFVPAKGELLANLQLRDEYIPREINHLDTITVNLTYGVNEVHRESFDLYNEKGQDFFQTAYPGVNGNGDFDTTQNGVANSTLIFKVVGNATLDPGAVIGSEGVITLQRPPANDAAPNAAPQTTEILYRADDTISDLLERINNSDGSINAVLNFENKLVIKSRPQTPNYSFALPYMEDTGGFLSSISEILASETSVFTSSSTNSVNQLHPDATFERTPLTHPSSWVSINPNIRADNGLIATRGGTDYDGQNGREVPYGSGDGSGAVAISALRFDQTLIDNRLTINEYYIEKVTAIGSHVKTAEIEAQQFATSLESLVALRQSISGVNIDEELANMITYQQGYQAGARIISVMDELLDTLLSLV